MSWFGDGITIVGALFSMFGLSRGAQLPFIEDAPLPALSWGETDDAEPQGFEWPEDWDAVPGWRIAAEARAAEIGLQLPGYRTRREYEAARNRCLAAFEPPALPAAADPPPPPAPPVVEIKPAWTSERTARAFLNHIMDNGGGQFTNEQLSERYLSFCRDVLSRHPAPENFVRQNLRTMRGVNVGQIDTRAENGRRIRPTLWTIRAREDRAPQTEVASETRIAA